MISLPKMLISLLLSSSLMQGGTGEREEERRQQQSNNNYDDTTTTHNHWYERYPDYPSYCSIPLEMSKRKIPPLSKSIHVGETRLKHVTAIIRHGARTPWSGDVNCWKDYWKDDTSRWDCDLKTFLAPPTPRDVEQENVGRTTSGSSSDAMFLFEKRYDALSYPQHNALWGTCQLGQLLLRGYDQELTNGKNLREAYVFDGSNMEHDPSLRLLDLSGDDDHRPYLEPSLVYRSDDDQRTLMSGQVLLRGLFGQEFIDHAEKHDGRSPIIPLHVSDRWQDILSPNKQECPNLSVLNQEALQSMEYKAFNSTKEYNTLRTMVINELGFTSDPLDCLMTTICTDRTLPDVLNDYHHHSSTGNNKKDYTTLYGPDRFERLYKFAVQQIVFPFLYNKNAYSKLAMGPLWSEIMERILPVLSGDSDRGGNNKLHVISAHDTTIIPLMASLGIWKLDQWPPYASTMLIELHRFIDSRTNKDVYPSYYAFRLVYNGEVWTDRITGCPKDTDLCDFTILQNITEDFMARDRPACRVQNVVNEIKLLETDARSVISAGGILLYLSTILISMALGAYTSRWYMKRKMKDLHTTIAATINDNGGYRDRVPVNAIQEDDDDYNNEQFTIDDDNDDNKNNIELT
eukprot:CAMPEP_0194144382 /NCGR_PEP_ID=MMETSP0152-20130528/13449_1 /TAXON_ID=1049557 /ORGANISM="Thalassiothrix antarctica, Strain L6-D1" /LENGTH=629 /DNA_ID=CAMNT_0038844219 /DNA_START=146 /DNA_END=2035 /DNA_ORIENTATION=+